MKNMETQKTVHIEGIGDVELSITAQEMLNEIPALANLTPGHIAAIETALGALGVEIVSTIKHAYTSYGTVVDKYAELVIKTYGSQKDSTETNDEC